MAVGKEDRGRFWVDAQLTVRLRGPGPEPGRILRLRRPFVMIGQIPGADVLIDDPAVEKRHAMLLVDRRGVFGVDLLTRTGTRFAGAEIGSAWLGPGDILEIAGRRVELLQLRIDGSIVDPPLSDEDPLGDAPDLIGLTLEPLDAPGPPWMLGSALAFIGRGDACAIRIENASASRTHCALLRTHYHSYVIDLLGRRTLINDRPVDGASILEDGDILTVGQARLVVRLERSMDQQLPATQAFSPLPPGGEPGVRVAVPAMAIEHRQFDASLATFHPSDPGPLAAGEGGRELALVRGPMVAMILDLPGTEILDVLRQFQADTATLLEAQIDRIEAMNREIAALRGEMRGHLGPPAEPAEPLHLDLIPPPIAPAGQPASWLLDRLNTLEAEGRSTWKDLLGRIASTVSPRPSAPPGQSLIPTPLEPGQGGHR